MHEEPPQLTEPDHRLLALSVALFAGVVGALEIHRELPALAIVVAIFLIARPRLLAEVDWALLATIGLMFVVLRQVVALSWLGRLLANLPIGHGLGAFLAAVIISQVMSNVPAAILLQNHVHDLRALVAGVNVGGYGWMTGSLANLIALRLAQDKGVVGDFHRLSIPFLLGATLLVGAWLVFRSTG
ncbi:transporter permease [Candidatus Methylacidithermus pantelleriae]|uniref:hypothetical protein n=1 Tax=Candidatus Methylacidithermus pantelleriae TaxID=2744239 RepID=UPI001BD6B80C|nr:hypothetical protein [Candidatus Methylacidithermus pantelleriae]